MFETSLEEFTETVLLIAPILGGAIFFMALVACGLFMVLVAIEVRMARNQRRWVNEVQTIRENQGNRRRSGEGLEEPGIPAHIIRDPAVVERTERFGGLNQQH